MSFLGQALGNLGGEAGDAFVADRKYQMERMVAQSQAQQALAQAGFLKQHGDVLQQQVDQGRWQPIGNAPVRNVQTGQWEYIIRDVRHGTIQRIPAGAPANSLDALLPQIPRDASGKPSIPGVGDREMELMIAKKLGVNNPFIGMTKEWRQIGNQEYAGYVDPRTQQWTPISDEKGQFVARGVSQAPVNVLDANNKPTIVNLPRRTAVTGQTMPPVAPSKGNSAGPTPPAGALPPTPTAPRAGNGNGLTPASALKEVPPELRSEIHYINKVDSLISAIEPGLAPLSKNDSIIDRFKSSFHSSVYGAGFNDAWSKINQLESLLNVLGGTAFMKGRPAMAFIEQIQQHLPKPWMTPAAQYQRIQDLKPLLQEWRGMAAQDAGMKMVGQQLIPGPPQSLVPEVNNQLQQRNPYRH